MDEKWIVKLGEIYLGGRIRVLGIAKKTSLLYQPFSNLVSYLFSRYVSSLQFQSLPPL